MRIGIIGATGYGGLELLRLLHHHKQAKVTALVSTSQTGQWSEVYPHWQSLGANSLQDLQVEALAEQVDLVFLATPAGVSKELTPKLRQAGLRFIIDLSGDLRLASQQAYRDWYRSEPAPQDCLDAAVYGLPELNRAAIEQADLIANPGCYPTAALIGLAPLVAQQLVQLETIIIDAKSGLSGAGRGLSLAGHFCEANESVRPYKLGSHQHIPEIEQWLQHIGGKETVVSFTPHLVPLTRGLICTMYVQLTEDLSEERIRALYSQFYTDAPFVRMRPCGVWPASKEVAGSNYCDIGLLLDARTKRLTIVAVIDNLVKGAAGQAIQNMNLIGGWDETEGLWFPPLYP